ncbi:Histone-lysine N-methyltransferase [Gracilaria domingensis]|nr:Histone-lysine N-methyltransferase [Gracilaria domingensis]
MPAGGQRKRLRSDGAVPLSKSPPTAECTIPPRRCRALPPFQHVTLPTVSHRRKSMRNTSENLQSETDDDIPIAKRRRRQIYRKANETGQAEPPIDHQTAVLYSSYSLRGNSKPNPSSKLNRLCEDNQHKGVVSNEGTQNISEHHQEQAQGMRESCAANIGRTKEKTTKLFAFPFKKEWNELSAYEKQTVKLFPVPLLWNNVKSRPGPRFTKLSELIQFLRGDTECSFYIGQDYCNSTEEILRGLMDQQFMGMIEECMEKNGVDQRVPILCPKRGKVDPPETWPLITDYHDFILCEHKKVLEHVQEETHYRQGSRKRLFCAGETSMLGLGPSSRTRAILMKWKKRLPIRTKRGRKRGVPQSNLGIAGTEERTNGKLMTRSRRRIESEGNNPKANLRTREASSEAPARPKRKRRPNVMYSDSVYDQLFSDSSGNEKEEKATSTKKSAKLRAGAPQCVPSEEKPEVMDKSLTEDFLGTESSENEVEIPVHLVTISDFIDYIPDEEVQSSSACSSHVEDETCHKHVEEPLCIVDKLDESEDGDSRDPLFDGIQDSILRMMDEEVSGELLTKHVLDEHPFDQEGQVVHGNLQESEAGRQDRSCKSRNVEIGPNGQEHTFQYGDHCRTNERKGHACSSEEKDAGTLQIPNDSNLDSSSSVKFPQSVSSRQQSSIGKDYIEAEKIDISDGGNSPKKGSNLEKHAAISVVDGEGPSKRARVRSSNQNQLVHKVPISTVDMLRYKNDSIQESGLSNTKQRKSTRVQNLQKTLGTQSEVQANTLLSGANHEHSSACDSSWVYLWDHEAGSRGTQLVPLRSAISACLESNRFSIYDGQDYDFKDSSSTSLTGVTEKDMTGWRNRATQSGKVRKVRIWNLGTGGLRPHFRSPAVQRLAGWIDSNPENVIFCPSMILPSVSIANRRSCLTTTPGVQKGDSQALKTCFRERVENHVIRRIRYLHIKEISKEDLACVQLWNTTRQRIVPSKSFICYGDLLRFLFTNPWLEPLSGQDQLFQLESSTLNKLIRVRMSCAPSIANYWDCVDKQVHHHDNITEEFGTVGELLASNPRYILYQGQDLSFYQSLVKYNAVLRAPGFPVLVQCGTEIQRQFFSQRWVTVVVDPSSCSTACAVFWNGKSKEIHMQPKMCSRMSISSYINAHPYMELYAGQDHSENVQQEVRHWMELLRECSPQKSIAVVLLTRIEFAPLKYNAISWPSLSKECGGKSIHNQKVSENLNSVFRNENQIPPEDTDDVVINASAERDPPVAPIQRRRRFITASEVDGAKCAREDLKSKQDETYKGSDAKKYKCITQSADEVIVLEPSVCTSIGSDDICSEDGFMCPELEEASQNFEERLRAPAKAAARVLTIIKEVGPRVLKQELVHDLRHTLYENTTMEVGSISQLLFLLQESNDLHFVRMAAELCITLESLDISGCFAGSVDVGYGTGDLLSIREDLESGKIFTMTDVIKRFRVVCQNLLQLNEGFYLENQAIDLKNQAEIVIRWYMKEKAEVFEREKKIRRLAKICDRARQIGFRKQRGRNPSSAATAAGSKGHDLTIRASNGQARVTFLNYRDEKGNSVMGKRTSVRVFGLPIDRQTCQREAGCARPCHICGREVFDADQDSLACGNRFFGSCKECVCKQCLESVTCMESQEFISFRDGQEWICVHCRGLCPAGSDCLRNGYERSRHNNRLETVRFTWPHKFAEPPLSVLVFLLRRQQNGEFDEDFERGVKVSLSKTPSGWSALTECRIGAYRALIKADGKWIAGTTFCVFSSDTIAATIPQKDNKRKVNRRYYTCQDRPSLSITRRGPSVRWNIAENDKSGPVHAIPGKDSNDANQMIEDCSRVNGYDWQRAKRHNVVHWRPVVQEADPPEVEGSKARSSRNQQKQHCFTSEPQKITLTHSVKDHSSWTRKGTTSPKPRPGLTYEQVCTEWNTFKFDEMLKSLWGIVTGRSGIHGIGLFTLTGYRKGDFIIEYAGDLIRTPLADIREARYEAAGLGTYLFKINEEEIVDATVQSNRARFTNHSCDPNMIARIIHVRGRDLVALQATRDIPRFAELTFDYKLPIEDTKVQCLCNAWNCVGVMN